MHLWADKLASLVLLDYVYINKIKPELNNYLESVFEDICIEYLKLKNKKMELPFIFTLYRIITLNIKSIVIIQYNVFFSYCPPLFSSIVKSASSYQS